MKTIVAAIFAVLLSVSTSFAVPLLQLYIEGATYDPGSETWVSSQNPFTLWVMGNVSGDGGKGTISDVFLSAAYPTSETGTITIAPTTTSLVTDPSTPGAPTIPSSDSHGDGTQPLEGDGTTYLPSHGIFGPGVSWDKYSIGNFSLTDSPTADLTASPPVWTASSGQINAYTVTVTGFSVVHFDSFDHYINPKGDAKYVFAPFSHDAEDTGGGGGKVPEPTTLLLLGSGLAAALPFVRRRFKKLNRF